MASFSSLEARNATFLEALILIASPVAGLRPMRGPRLRTTRMPRPFRRMRAPFFRCLVISPIVSSRIALAAFWESSCFSASWLARLRVETVSTFAFAAVAIGNLPLNESTMAPILRHFLQDKGGEDQKNARNWGIFGLCTGKAPKTGRFRTPKSNRAAKDMPARPDLQGFYVPYAASEPWASTTLSVRSLMRADLPVRPRR